MVDIPLNKDLPYVCNAFKILQCEIMITYVLCKYPVLSKPGLLNNYLVVLIFSMIASVWFGLVWFSGISAIIGYLVPNLVFTYILDI